MRLPCAVCVTFSRLHSNSITSCAGNREKETERERERERDRWRNGEREGTMVCKDNYQHEAQVSAIDM